MSFRNKILFMFLIFSICPMVFVTGIIFHNSEEHFKELIILRLEDIAEHRIDKIKSFFSNITTGIKIAQDYWNIKDNLPILEKYINDKENPFYIKAKETLGSQLITLQKLGKLSDVMLVLVVSI